MQLRCAAIACTAPPAACTHPARAVWSRSCSSGAGWSVRESLLVVRDRAVRCIVAQSCGAAFVCLRGCASRLRRDHPHSGRSPASRCKRIEGARSNTTQWRSSSSGTALPARSHHSKAQPRGSQPARSDAAPGHDESAVMEGAHQRHSATRGRGSGANRTSNTRRCRHEAAGRCCCSALDHRSRSALHSGGPANRRRTALQR